MHCVATRLGRVGIAYRCELVLGSSPSVRNMVVTKHLGPDSECPPLKPGVLRLYSMKFCPFAERTRLVLAAKDIPHEEVNIRLDEKPGWYLQKYPAGKVPALEKDGMFVSESLITCDLLDELYPEPALQAKDPWQRAQDRWLVEQFQPCVSSLYKMYYAKGDPEKIKFLSAEFNKGIMAFEHEIVRRGTPYFFGDRPGMVDLMIWPWMERFPAARKLGLTWLPAGDMPPPPPEIAELHQWIMRMSQHPIVAKVHISTENHMKFLDNRITHCINDYEMDC